MKTQNHLKRESATVSKMIALYCRKHHEPSNGTLCQDCLNLESYAHLRIERCPFGLRKPTCAKCPVHCYKPDRREQIRAVMRFAGPRMLVYHPVLAVLHLLDDFRKTPTQS